MKQGLVEAEATFFERDPTGVADHEVVEDVHIEELARFDDGAGDGHVFGAGEGSLLGWLWATTMAAALTRTACLNNSPTRMSDVFKLPW